MATIRGTWWNDNLFGSNVADLIFGDWGDDTIYGNGGNDEIFGDNGADFLVGGFGSDTLHGGNDNDSLFGEGDNDVLFGDAGNDLLDGGSGNDSLFGGDGSDTLRGGVGDDFLDGGAGSDVLRGGAGNDTYVVRAGAGDQIIENDGEGFDTVNYSGGGVVAFFDGPVERMVVTDSMATEVISIGTMVNQIFGGGGNDTLRGAGGNDIIDGGGGNDWLMGEDDNDSLSGNIGNDTLQGGAGDDWVDGGAGSDYMEGNAGNDTFVVDNVGDWVAEWAGQGIDTIRASISYTLSNSSDVENLTLIEGFAIDGTGNELNNTLTGNSLNNFLNGSGGADVIIGGGGADILMGGGGSDRFVFLAVGDSTVGASDQITDFIAAEGDKIDLSAIDADVTTPGDQAFNFIGNNNAFVPGLGAGQLRYNGGFVEGDINGDLVADFRIGVTAPSLVAGDFIL